MPFLIERGNPMIMNYINKSVSTIMLAPIGDEVARGINEVIAQIRSIVNPIATVAIIGCGLYLLLGSDPVNIKRAKGWGLSILVGLIVINLADIIVERASALEGWPNTAVEKPEDRQHSATVPDQFT